MVREMESLAHEGLAGLACKREDLIERLSRLRDSA